jgi:hypothetical protein
MATNLLIASFCFTVWAQALPQASPPLVSLAKVFKQDWYVMKGLDAVFKEQASKTCCTLLFVGTLPMLLIT